MSSPIRYFAKETFEGDLYGLRRYGVVDGIFVDQYFNGEWHDDPDTAIAAFLVMGEGWYHEFTEEEARAYKPEAFL